MAEKVRSRLEGRVLYVTLAHPEDGNLLDEGMLAGLETALRAEWGRAEVLVLGAEGPVFSLGRPRGRPGDLLQFRRALEQVVKLNGHIGRWPGGSLAAVRGGAWGAAAGLMAHCDVVLAAAGARFGFPEVTYGVPPAVVASYLPRRMSLRGALYLLLTGQEVTADAAREWGLVTEVVPEERLEARLGELVRLLTGLGPGVLRTCKEAVLEFQDLTEGEIGRRPIDRLMAWMSQERALGG
jgi:enoyl-CoA hydratase/carnithine racemase